MAQKNVMRFEGIEEFDKILVAIGNEVFQKRGEMAALSRAAKPIHEQARNEVKKEVKGSDNDGFSKLLLLSSLLSIRKYKGGITIAWRKNDIPIRGLRGRDAFTAFGYARLMAQGRQWTAKTTAARRKYQTGTTTGYGDFIEASWRKMALTASQIYKRERIPQIQKAMDRAVRKYSKGL